MANTKTITRKSKLKEKAFVEFDKGKFTPRELAVKYGICETELSRFFSAKMKASGYPQLHSYQTTKQS